MRNDIRGAFDKMLPEPHPALQSLVHERLRAGRKGRENVTLQRFIQIGAALVAIVILGAVAFSFLASGQRQHGGVPVWVGTPSPSPSPTATADLSPAPSCSGTYTVSGNMIAVTAVTDTSPLKVIVLVSDQRGDRTTSTQNVLPKGQSLIKFTLQVSPPVTSVDIVLNRTSGGTLGTCLATPAG